MLLMVVGLNLTAILLRLGMAKLSLQITLAFLGSVA